MDAIKKRDSTDELARLTGAVRGQVLLTAVVGGAEVAIHREEIELLPPSHWGGMPAFRAEAAYKAATNATAKVGGSRLLSKPQLAAYTAERQAGRCQPCRA